MSMCELNTAFERVTSKQMKAGIREGEGAEAGIMLQSGSGYESPPGCIPV